MMSTATAAVNASAADAPNASQPRKRPERDRDDNRHEDGRDPVGEALHRRLPRLRSLDEVRDLASAVSAPTLVARTTSRPVGVEAPAGDLASDRDLDRQRLPGQHRLVDRRPAVSTIPSVAIFSPGRTTSDAHVDVLQWDSHLLAVTDDSGLLGAELLAAADGLERALWCPGLR
jgi:hypothetical protein